MLLSTGRFYNRVSGGGGVGIEGYVTSDYRSAAASPITFSSVNLSTPAADRQIIVAITLRMTSTPGDTISGVTIGGVTAT